MKISVDNTVIETSGVGESDRFRIAPTAKAFLILSDGLYSDKPLAVVRELSCNAYDAHVAAGKPNEPFEIHLPTKLEPWFSVKDNGIGLSHENVMTLYSTYFESTKSTSDDFVGAFGLGSKSPFSYTKSFNVTSRYNGVENVYVMFVGEKGFPTVTPMGSSPTEEGNGVEVTVPVNGSDGRLFVDAAERVFKYFAVRPKTNSPLRFEEAEIILEKGNWKVFKGNSYNPRIVARMGNVAYPVKLSIEQLQKYVRMFDRSEILLDFNIGELEVAASREELSYDDRTIANIVGRFEEIMTEAVQVAKSEIAKAKTLWDATVLTHSRYLDMYAGSRFVSNIIRSTPNLLTWNGKKISTDRYITIPESFERVWDSKGDKKVPTADTVDVYSVQDADRLYRVSGRHGNMQYYDKTTFIIGDCHDANSRARAYYSDDPTVGRRNIFLLKAKNEARIKELLDLIGNPKTITASTLPKAPPKVKAAALTHVNVRRFQGTNCRSGKYTYNSWTTDSVNPNDKNVTYYYIPTKLAVPQRNGGDWPGMERVLVLIRELTGTRFNIIGLPSKMEAEIDPTTKANWVNFAEYVKEVLLKMETDPRISTQIVLAINKDELSEIGIDASWTSRGNLIKVLNAGMKDFNIPKDFKAFHKLVTTAISASRHNTLTLATNFKQAWRLVFNKPYVPTNSGISIAASWKKLVSKYAMIQMLVHYNDDIAPMIPTVLDYVKQTNNCLTNDDNDYIMH